MGIKPPAPLGAGGRGGARPGAGRPKGSKNRRFRRRSQVEVQEMGAGYTGEAVATMIRAMRAPDSSWGEKLKASDMLLNHTYGRPAQQVQVAMRGVVEHKIYRSDEELRAALIAKGVHPLLLPPPFVDDAMSQVCEQAPQEDVSDGRPDSTD